jgi:hypothetical protein
MIGRSRLAATCAALALATLNPGPPERPRTRTEREQRRPASRHAGACVPGTFKRRKKP